MMFDVSKYRRPNSLSSKNPINHQRQQFSLAMVLSMEDQCETYWSGPIVRSKAKQGSRSISLRDFREYIGQRRKGEMGGRRHSVGFDSADNWHHVC